MSAATNFLALVLRGPSTLVAIHPARSDEIAGLAVDGDSLAEADTWLTLHSGCNLYWTPNEVAGRIHKKPKKADITRLFYVHLDLDDPSDAALERLRGYRLAPTFIIFSGGGYQAFWEISDPPLVNGNAEALEAANKQVIADLGGDAGTWNLDRIMRLPGTTNRPTAKKLAQGRVPVEARLIEHHPDRRYKLADFGAVVPAAAPRETPSINDEWPPLDQYDGDGSRHLLACVRVAVLEKHLGDDSIHTLFNGHEHAARQSNPVRAVQRCIDLVRSELPPAGDVLEGITDSRLLALLRPHVDTGAVVVASDHIPHSIAARVTLRALSPSLFCQGGQVVEVARTKDGAIIQPVRDHALASRVDDRRSVVKVHFKDGRYSVGPTRMPVSSATIVLASSAVREELRPIELVMRRPIAVEHEGRLVLLRPGYNDGVGVFVVGGQEMPDVPLDDARAALLSLLGGFQFASDADHARAVGALVMPALKLGRMFNGPTPLVLDEGDQSQAGKTLRSAVNAAIYGEQAQVVAQRERGGVGSLDESFSEALLRGQPFIRFDNFRGEVNSPFLEAVITAGSDPILCRVPYRAPVWVDASHFIFQMTSNGVELTPDQANRVLVVRLVRRPDGFEFRAYAEGSLLAHVKAQQPYYAGCVLAVVRRWFDAGKPRNPVPHTFTALGALDWIVRNVFGLGPLMEAHCDITTRLASPNDAFVRALVLELEHQKRLGRWLMTSALVEVARATQLAPSSGWSVADDEANKQMGRLLAKVFARGEERDFGHLRLRRVVGTFNSKPTKYYCVWRPADGPPPAFVDEDAPL